MSGLLIVLAAVFLLLSLQFNKVNAAGPYDGEWTGTASSAGERCRRAVVKLTVKSRDVSGQAMFERDTSKINGTAAADGAAGATIGFPPLWGRFTGDEFEGAFGEFRLRVEGCSGARESRPELIFQPVSSR